MKREKFPKPAEIRIKFDEALERRLANAMTWKNDSTFKDPEVQHACRVIQKKVGLLSLLDFWPTSEVLEVLDLEPRERFTEFELENVVRHVFAERIPEVIVKRSDGTIVRNDRIMTYCWEVDRDGWGCETGWFYFDFAVFKDENFGEVEFCGTFKTSIDVLHANEGELQTWLYARDWEFEERDHEELVKKYDEEQDDRYVWARAKVMFINHMRKED